MSIKWGNYFGNCHRHLLHNRTHRFLPKFCVSGRIWHIKTLNLFRHESRRAKHQKHLIIFLQWAKRKEKTNVQSLSVFRQKYRRRSFSLLIKARPHSYIVLIFTLWSQQLQWIFDETVFHQEFCHNMSSSQT